MTNSSNAIIETIHTLPVSEVYSSLRTQPQGLSQEEVHLLADLLGYALMSSSIRLGTGEVEMVEVVIPHPFVGRLISELISAGEFQLVALTRNGRTSLPVPGTLFREGDLAHLVVSTNHVKDLADLLG